MPSFILTDKNYIDLARREILRVIGQNKKKIVENRMTPKMVKEVLPIPIELWKYFEKRCRTSGIPMPFDSAVRNLSKKVVFTVREDGLYLEGLRYNSLKLKNTDLFNRVIGTGRIEIDGYLPTLVTRKAWVEYEGRIIEVDAIMPIVTDESEYDITLEELSEISKLRRSNRAFLEENKSAVNGAVKEEFQRITGKEWDSGSRKFGRPNRKTTQAMQEFYMTNKAIGKG